MDKLINFLKDKITNEISLEEIINVAPKLPLTGKIMVDANEILDIAKDIRLSFPDDVQQQYHQK